MDEHVLKGGPPTLSLGELERRALRSTVEDGAAELILGLFLVALAMHGMTGSYVYIPVIVLAAPMWRALRRRFVEPRVGGVQLNDARTVQLKSAKRIAAIVVAPVVLLIIGTVFIDAPWRKPLSEFKPLLLVGILSLPIIIAGFLLRTPRFFAHAGVLIVAGMMSIFGVFTFNVALTLAGLVIGICGGVLFILLVRRYPISSVEGDERG